LGIQFQYKEFTWVFLVIALFALLFLSVWLWKRKVRKKMGDPALIKALSKGFSPALFSGKFILLTLGFAAGVVAIMNPRQPGAADNLTRKGIDVMIAMDVSKSMLASDFAPNRLERAKQFVNKLMEEMPDDRIGLVLFAGKAYLQMPLTLDHGAAKLFVSSASPDAVPQQGTVISDALDISVKAFNVREGRFKTIVLISDGEEHDPAAVTTAEELSNRGVMINTVGVGSVQGSTIIDPATGMNKTDEAGNTVISKLNEDVLKQIAEKTNGAYVHLESSDDAVAAIKKQLSQIEAKAISDISLVNYKTFFMWFAGLMFFLLLVENFIPERKKVKA
jgi:Ca-activated chloride channel family protein